VKEMIKVSQTVININPSSFCWGALTVLHQVRWLYDESAGFLLIRSHTYVCQSRAEREDIHFCLQANKFIPAARENERKNRVILLNKFVHL
jgi:hypothetical protein